MNGTRDVEVVVVTKDSDAKSVLWCITDKGFDRASIAMLSSEWDVITSVTTNRVRIRLLYGYG